MEYVINEDLPTDGLTVEVILKNEATTTLKEFSSEAYWLTSNCYVSFPQKGEIDITTECSISW